MAAGGLAARPAASPAWSCCRDLGLQGAGKRRGRSEHWAVSSASFLDVDSYVGDKIVPNIYSARFGKGATSLDNRFKLNKALFLQYTAFDGQMEKTPMCHCPAVFWAELWTPGAVVAVLPEHKGWGSGGDVVVVAAGPGVSASKHVKVWIIGDVCAWDHIHPYQCLVCGSAIITSRPFWSHSSCVLFLWPYNVSHHHAKFVIRLVWLFIFSSKSWKPALAPWKDVEDLSHMRTVLEILC